MVLDVGVDLVVTLGAVEFFHVVGLVAEDCLAADDQVAVAIGGGCGAAGLACQ